MVSRPRDSPGQRLGIFETFSESTKFIPPNPVHSMGIPMHRLQRNYNVSGAWGIKKSGRSAASHRVLSNSSSQSTGHSYFFPQHRQAFCSFRRQGKLFKNQT
ncbi:hypothetical protein I7I48_02833 [Histoplasma ohiense]|nr:hypothetical protein I7I48_02833 [Histoplasma ohiense (nom. inval.)]